MASPLCVFDEIHLTIQLFSCGGGGGGGSSYKDDGVFPIHGS